MRIAAILVAVVSPFSAGSVVTAQQVAFEHVTVLPMDLERTLSDQTVVVRDGRIVSVGPAASTNIPDGAIRVDGTGKFLMPGLAEMHGHLPSQQWPEAAVDRLLFLNVANGVTTVRGMQGNPAQLRLRDEIETDGRLGPQLILGSPALGGNAVTDPATGANLVRQYHSAGYDLLKVHEGLSLQTFDSISVVARELDMPFGGHIAEAVGLAHSIESGISTVEHLDGFIEELQRDGETPNTPAGFFGMDWAASVDRGEIRPLAARLDRTDTWITPTQTLFVNFLSGRSIAELQADPRLGIKYWLTDQVDRWVNRISDFRASMDVHNAAAMLSVREEIFQAVRDAGGKILLGADSPQVFNVPGFATVYEAETMVEAGLTPFEVLTAGTRNPAIYLDRADDFGTVAVGMRADLILLDQNPLDDITNLRKRAGVMVSGRWLPIEEINRRLEELEEGV